MSVSYDAGTNTATYVFGGMLPEGNYAARLLAGQVANAAGYHLDGNGDEVAGDDYTLGFYNLAGDLNGDGKVDAADFAILSRGFGKTGASYAQGDLNGDGTVNLADLLLLTRDFGHAAPPPTLSATDVLLATVKDPKPLAAARRR